MIQSRLSANHFVFTGERTMVVYQSDRNGPPFGNPDLNRASLEYQGPAGTQTFIDKEITLQSIPKGQLIIVMLTARDTASAIFLTLVIPTITLTTDQSVTFETLLLQARTRGLANGPAMLYAVLPLLGIASHVVQPLAMLALSN